MNILVVAAHPDDEVLGAGGTIAWHAGKGDRVTVAILGEGISSRFSSRGKVNRSFITDLKADARRASRVMGCTGVKLFDFPDNRFDSMDLLKIVKRIEALTEEIQPEIVYTHHHGDLNIDHEITARAVMTAFRPMPGFPVRRILAFEVPSATHWSFPEHAFVPTVFVDISKTLAMKLEALKCYRSEVRPYPHPRASESLEARAKVWGSTMGVGAAEAFVLLRELVL